MGGSSSTVFQVKLGFEFLLAGRNEKPENSGKTLGVRTKNQPRNTTHTCGKARESNAGYGVERRAHYYCDFHSLKKAPFFPLFGVQDPSRSDF